MSRLRALTLARATKKSGMGGSASPRLGSSSSQDLLRRRSLGEFVDELVQAADIPHQRIGDAFDANAADHARYLGRAGFSLDASATP